MSVKENGKKNDFSDIFFLFFQLLEIENIYIYIYNNYIEKKNGADLEGLLPKSYCEEIFCIAREWVVLQRFRLG